MSQPAQPPPQPQMRSDSDQQRLLLVIIAVLLPWAAVLVKEGCGAHAVLCFLLTCLFYLPGLIYALVIVLREDKYPAQYHHQGQPMQQQAPAGSYQYTAQDHSARQPVPVSNPYEPTATAVSQEPAAPLYQETESKS